MRPASPLQRRLESLRADSAAGIIPFVTGGHPSPGAIVPLLQALDRAGAVAVEIGIPFTDPLADGPAIQRSSQVALEAGITLAGILDAIGEFHGSSTLPVVVMSYANPVLAFGVERFADAARAAGVSGVLLTDLPPEERPDVWAALEARELDAIRLIAPTTARERRTQLARGSRGFVYCVSRLGVTGAASGFAPELGELVGEVRAATSTPVAIGFGVRNAERARQAARLAEGVIVGAALCERLEEKRALGLEPAVREAERFVAGLVRAVSEESSEGRNGRAAG